jgi:hypothetical protein
VLSKCLLFHYHTTHVLEDGSLKCTGPCDATHASLALTYRKDGSQELYGGSGTAGTVYLENQGALANATVQTRRMKLMGIGGDYRVDRVYAGHTLYDFADSTPGNVTTTLLLHKPNVTQRSSEAKTVEILAYPSDGSASPRREMTLETQFNESAEDVQLLVNFGASNVRQALDYLAVPWEPIAQNK